MAATAAAAAVVKTPSGKPSQYLSGVALDPVLLGDFAAREAAADECMLQMQETMSKLATLWARLTELDSWDGGVNGGQPAVITVEVARKTDPATKERPAHGREVLWPTQIS
jgi:hypothetical protein